LPILLGQRRGVNQDLETCCPRLQPMGKYRSKTERTIAERYISAVARTWVGMTKAVEIKSIKLAI